MYDQYTLRFYHFVGVIVCSSPGVAIVTAFYSPHLTARAVALRPSLADTTPVKARARRLEPLRSTRAERPWVLKFHISSDR